MKYLLAVVLAIGCIGYNKDGTLKLGPKSPEPVVDGGVR